ncbi:MAG: cell envelope integrity protein TolA [Pseudomonadales bacterium]
MNSLGSYIPSFILASAFHALVIAALMWNWDNSSPIDVTPVTPYYIEANVVAENPHTAKAKQAAATAAARERARRERIETERVAAQRRAKLDEEKLAKARQQAAEREKQEQDRLAQFRVQQQAADAEAEAIAAQELSEEDRLKREQSLALAVMDELEYRRAVTDDEKAMAYVAQIQQDIVQRWSRPPSARNGMQALLKVRLVPTGEVVDVAVIESSGNDAFDRSAIQAVEKAERFLVPSESRQFERNFREFEVLFRPEDLRL